MNKSWEEILTRVGNFEMRKGLFSFINPYSMLILRRHPDIAKAMDKWYVDGISLVNKLNRELDIELERYSFDDTSLAPIVFKFAQQKRLKVAVIGTKEEYIYRAVANIEKKHSVNIAFFRNGYFKSLKERELTICKIIDDKIDIVICGMGTPFQEEFLVDLRTKGWFGYGFTCGGYLHQIANQENYYPPFFDRFNIRWVYRILDEPKLLKRYAILYPKFFIRFFFFRKNRPASIL